MDLIYRVEAAKDRAVKFLLSMQIEDGIFDTSPYNKMNVPGMALPATYNAVSALGLMKSLHLIDKDKSIKFILSNRVRGGWNRIKGMKRKDLSYPNFEYDNMHITNYCISALDYLDYKFTIKDLTFLRKYNNNKKLMKWLTKRDMCAPWTEGNYVVNLASFMILAKELNIPGADRSIEQMIKWHYDNQDEFGFYHDTEINDLTNAFAGATHNYHIFYYYNLPIARYKQVIDYLLTRPTVPESACLDVDEVDVLVNFIKYGYRTEDIKKWLKDKLINLLDFQNEDGGFADELSGNRLFDGWTKYIEPQGISNCFATWFRMIAIGMIAMTLFKDYDGFLFRKTIGIGYFNNNYLLSGYDEEGLKEQEERILSRANNKRSSLNNDTVNLDDDKVSDLIEIFKDKFNKIDNAKLSGEAIFSITVIGEGSFSIILKDNKAEVTKGINPSFNLSVTLKRQTLIKIISNKLDARLAYGLGKLKCKGNISYALKLSVLL